MSTSSRPSDRASSPGWSPLVRSRAIRLAAGAYFALVGVVAIALRASA